jgi:hypothetical protein
VHLGYRRRSAGEAGVWFVRTYVGGERYKTAVIGLTDDFPGAEVLTFEQAQKQALAHPLARGEAAPRAGLTVADAVKDYVGWLATHRATARDAALRAEKLILPALGKMKVAELTTTQLSKWRDAMAEKPKLVRTKKGEPQAYGAVPATKEEKRARRASANRVLTTLKAALNLAFRQGEVGDDTAWRRLKGFDRVEAARTGLPLGRGGATSHQRRRRRQWVPRFGYRSPPNRREIRRANSFALSRFCSRQGTHSHE